MSTLHPVTFHVWGARGSIFAGGADKTEFGGDTTCFSIESPRGLVAIDAGSGLRSLGRALLRDPAGPPTVVDILLTHLHFDHICGLPFFDPLLQQATRVRVWSAVFDDPEALRATLARALAPPIFPVDTTLWQALEICTPGCGNLVPLAMGGEACAFALNHPDGACGWRIECFGRVISIASDHEMGNGAIDAVIAEASHKADVLVCDASYTEEEIVHRRGWGHSTWQQGLTLGARAAARHIVMTHHAPERNDDDVAAMEEQARKIEPNTTFARSGWSLPL